MAKVASAFTDISFGPPRKPEQWNKYAHKILKTMHHCLSVLYDGVEVEDSISALDESDNTTLPNDAPVSSVAEIFVKHCDSLDKLLSSPTNWPVQIPMNSIINILARCLRVTSADLRSRPSLLELSEVLPELHQSAHAALIQLIVCCGSNVLPQSRTIIDGCIHSIAGSKHIKGESKSNTRAKAYQVLGLILTKFGWGRYLQSLSQLLIQDLISDICVQEASKTQSLVGTAANSSQEVELVAHHKSKKKKKSKKHKGDSYSDFPLPMADDKGSIKKQELSNVKATQQALMLSRLIVERAEYSQVQSLVRNLLNTSKSLQREGPSDSSPYNSEDCRKLLYSAVFACATVRLGCNSNRKDTISHFQATNLALSVLTRASHTETSSEIQNSCRQSLTLLSNTGNLNRPIVRRVLPDEQSTIKDVMEVEKEAERLGEENKSLWKQLVDAQLETETQQRQLEQLQEELALSKSAAHSQPRNTSEKEEKTSRPTNDEPTSQEEEKAKSVTEDEDRNDTSDPEEMDPQERKEKAVIREETISVTEKRFQTDMQSAVNTSSSKRRVLEDSDKQAMKSKKAKTDDEQGAAESDDLQAMIADFVDVAADQD
ncbi:proline-, glutamic acid- and leucine-rich protein 1 [Plakobranchus ocellatus]|uniref:Proline-, glutamic acid- and leucine-rich protein 1 n=1 Tax=Plakobranchus ocellatus TaxID=259542 RepID=A0AAV4D7B0_9GAST|nr:proline-, glutamic acid- and leucine-rich protein 1 [Plakobranchus ocellatus]